MTDPTGQIADLTRRIALLEDREALRGVLVHGWRALDYKDWDGWIRNWTDDAQFDFGPWGVLDGKQSIRDKVVASEEPYAAMMHQLLNMQFEVDGDNATGIGFMWFVGIADKDKPSEIISLGGALRMGVPSRSGRMEDQPHPPQHLVAAGRGHDECLPMRACGRSLRRRRGATC